MNFVRRVQLVVGEDPARGLAFYCPACAETHIIRVDVPGAWTYDGNDAAPTITPSVKCEVRTPPDEQGNTTLISCCHSVITAGKIQFCGDCTHALANQAVPMVEFPERE